MKVLRQSSRAKAFTLLEVIIVLAITALVLGAVYSLAQGTLLLADDVRRAERRDARMQAFTTFCEHLLAELPANALLTLTTTEEHGQYLTRLEFEHVPSPFDGTPNRTVTLFTKGQPGGGLRLLLNCQSTPSDTAANSIVLFDDLAQLEWSVFHPTSRQWATFWSEDSPSRVPTAPAHPPLMKLVLKQAGGKSQKQAFWIVPSEPMMLTAAPTIAPLAPKAPR